MTLNINAELISIGTEILLGEITDTNSVFLARTLRDLGINVFYMTSVGDNEQRISKVIRDAMGRSDIVITCGGLGPTVDDMTRQGVAIATDRGLTFHQSLLDQIADRFSKFRVSMTENNRRQAFLPDDAIVIENPVGTAPGFIVEADNKVVISLPGVPREMKFLMHEAVIPYLRRKFNLTEQIILAKVLKTAGIGESTLDEILGSEILEHNNPTVGLAAHSGQIDVRITAKADTHAQAQEMINEVEKKVRERLDEYVFGVNEDTLEQAIVTLLRDTNTSLAVSETGTNQIIQKRLSGFSDFSFVAKHYSSLDELRQEVSILPSEALRGLANKEAQRLLNATKSTVCVIVVSNPEIDESQDSNAETVVVVCTDKAVRERTYGFGGQSKDLDQFVGNWSLAVAWRMLKDVLDNGA